MSSGLLMQRDEHESLIEDMTFAQLLENAVPSEEAFFEVSANGRPLDDWVEIQSQFYQLNRKMPETMPVHLGMICLLTIRSMLKHFPEFSPEDVICTKQQRNHKKYFDIPGKLAHLKLRGISTEDIHFIDLGKLLKQIGDENTFESEPLVNEISHKEKANPLILSTFQQEEHEWFQPLFKIYSNTEILFILNFEINEYCESLRHIQACPDDENGRLDCIFELADIFIATVNVMNYFGIPINDAMQNIPYESYLCALNLPMEVLGYNKRKNKIEFMMWLKWKKIIWKLKRI